MEYLLGFLGVLTVLSVFAGRPEGAFHATMSVWFLVAVSWLILSFFGASLPTVEPFSSLFYFGLIIPFIYFVMHGAHLTINDVRRGVQKVNRHLDESHAERWSPVQWHDGRQFIYDHERNEWYVFVAHVEKWEPLHG